MNPFQEQPSDNMSESTLEMKQEDTGESKARENDKADDNQTLILEPDTIVEALDDEVIQGAFEKSARTMASTFAAMPQPKINTEGFVEAMAPVFEAAKAYKLTNEQMKNLVNGLSTFAGSIGAQKHALAERIRQNSRSEESTSGSETREADAPDEQADKKTTIIQQQTNVIQNGDNNVNVTNNGTINLNF